MSVWVCTRFSDFYPPPKNMSVGQSATLSGLLEWCEHVCAQWPVMDWGPNQGYIPTVSVPRIVFLSITEGLMTETLELVFWIEFRFGFADSERAWVLSGPLSLRRDVYAHTKAFLFPLSWSRKPVSCIISAYISLPSPCHILQTWQTNAYISTNRHNKGKTNIKSDRKMLTRNSFITTYHWF